MELWGSGKSPGARCARTTVTSQRTTRVLWTPRDFTRTHSDGTLTKVKELLHGQRRRGELGEPLHLPRYAQHRDVFQQKPSEPHFGPTATNARVFLRALLELSLAARQTAFSQHNSGKDLRASVAPLSPILLGVLQILSRLSDVLRRPPRCCWTEGVGGASVQPTNQREEMRRLHPPFILLIAVVLIIDLF